MCTRAELNAFLPRLSLFPIGHSFLYCILAVHTLPVFCGTSNRFNVPSARLVNGVDRMQFTCLIGLSIMTSELMAGLSVSMAVDHHQCDKCTSNFIYYFMTDDVKVNIFTFYFFLLIIISGFIIAYDRLVFRYILSMK